MAHEDITNAESLTSSDTLSINDIAQQLATATYSQLGYSKDKIRPYNFKLSAFLIRPKWFDSPYTIFDTNTEFSDQIHSGIRQAEDYLHQKTSEVLHNGSEAQLALDTLQHVISTVKQEAAKSHMTVTMRDPTWIEADQRAKALFAQRFPGVDLSKIDHDQFYRLEWNRIQQRAAFEAIAAKQLNPIYAQQLETISQLQINIRDTIINTLLRLGIPLNISRDETGEPIVKFGDQKLYPNWNSFSPFNDLLLETLLATGDSAIFKSFTHTDTTRSELIKLVTLGSIYSAAYMLHLYLNDICGDDPEARLDTLKNFADGDFDKYGQADTYAIVHNLPPFTKGQVSDNELAAYVIGQMLLGSIPPDLTPITQLLKSINSTDTDVMYESPDSPLVLPSVSSDIPRKVFGAASEEYARLQTSTFLLKGEHTQLACIDRLVAPTDYSQTWQPVTLTDSEPSTSTVTIKSLVATEGEYIDHVIANGEAVYGKIYALAIPPGYEISNLVLYTEDGVIPPLNQFDAPNYSLYRSPAGQYMLAASSHHFRSQIKYDVQIKSLPEQIISKDFQLTQIETSRLQAVSQRIGQMGQAFTSLAVSLYTLSQQDTPPTVSQLEHTIRNSFQYTILGKDTTIQTPQVEPDNLEFILADTALGVVDDGLQTKKLRVQCQHAAVITQAILSEIFPADEGSSIVRRSVVKQKSLGSNDAIMGTLHADLLIERNGHTTVIDTTPPLEDAVLQMELDQSFATSHTSTDIDARRYDVLSILEGLDGIVLQEKVTPDQRQKFLQTTPSDISQISGRTDPHTKLYIILSYLYKYPEIPYQTRTQCMQILDSFIQEAHVLSQLTPEERRRYAREIARFYKLGQHGTKSYSIISLGSIAARIKSMLTVEGSQNGSTSSLT